MIEQFNEVARESFVGQRLVERRFGFPVPANVRTHDAIIACEVRNPAMQAQRTAHPRMNQDNRLGFFPRIGEIVFKIVQLRAVAGVPEIGGGHDGSRPGYAPGFELA